MTSGIGSEPDLFLVGTRADRLLERIEELCVTHSIRSRVMNLRQFSTHLSMRLDHGRLQTNLTAPVLLRREKAIPENTATQRFLWNEAYAAVWSGCAISKARIINRPSIHGPVDLTSASLGVKLRTISPRLAAHLPAEWFTEAARNVVDNEDRSAMNYLYQPPNAAGFSVVPQKCRAERLDDWHTERVIIAADGVWVRPGTVGSECLIALTCSVVEALGLNFASLHWRLSRSDVTPELMSISSHPEVDEIVDIFDPVCLALLGALVR